MYAARCLDCHQADGRGRDGLAPPLAGSGVVGGPAGALAAFIFASSQHARFAPLSSAELANADVAALVTYLRREFSGDAP
jgi:mono/diheme cytochrome c family protein